MRWAPPAAWTEGMTKAQLEAWNTASWVEMAVMPVRARCLAACLHCRPLRLLLYPPPACPALLSRARSLPACVSLQVAVNLCWVCLYYAVVFVLVNKRIKERGYENM